MDDAIYIAASGMNAVQRMLENSTYNTVNSNTPGFQRNRVLMQSFGSFLEEAGDRRDLVGAREQISFEQGTLRPSELPHAVALEGEGFFAVQGPDGEDLYTRNGDFTVDSQGLLRTRSGLEVQGEGGAKITIDPRRGAIAVETDGSIIQEGAAIGRLRVVEFEDRNALQQRSETLYADPEGGAFEAANTVVHHRYLEMPKFNGAAGAIEMIIANRNYEAMSRAIRALDDSKERLIQSIQ